MIWETIPSIAMSDVKSADNILRSDATGTIVWGIFFPALAFFFLKRNYKELGDLARSNGCLIAFLIGLVIIVIGCISGFVDAPALSYITQFGGLGMFISALIEGCKFASALKRDYYDCAISYRSTWPAGLIAIGILFVVVVVVVAAA